MDVLEQSVRVTPGMARELAISERVCVRPILRRVIDRDLDTESTVAIPCGSTRETVCPPCAHKARVLRMQQCAEGWHATTEPDHDHDDQDQEQDGRDEVSDGDGDDDLGQDDEAGTDRRVRSTRRRDDATDLPGCRLRIAPLGGCSPLRLGVSIGRRCSSP